ncbi:MAG: hypothetical protein KDK26_08720 [Roseivivax sp.]|nr:hypothetical protein [Roseivivax sp.]
MERKDKRLVAPRMWAGLTLAGAAIGAAAAAAGPVPPRMAVPQAGVEGAPLWLVQAEEGEGGEAGTEAEEGQGGEAAPAAPSEGGEGGEGGAPAGIDAETALLLDLGKLEAHLLAAEALFAAGSADDAAALVYHPQAEFMEELEEHLEDLGLADAVTPALEALTDDVAKGADPAALAPRFAASYAAIRAAEAAAPGGASARYGALVLLVRDAAGEYTAAISDGALADPVAVEEARGFLVAARRLAEAEAGDPSARQTVLDILDDTLARAFGSGAGFTPDPSLIHGAAARVEIAGLMAR